MIKRSLPQVQEYQNQLSDPFPGSAGVNAVYATTGGEGLRQQTMGTDGHIDPGNLGVALTNIRRGINNDALTLNVQLNYWAGDIVQQLTGTSPTREFWGDGNPSWDTGTVYVAGDLTIKGNGGDKGKHKAVLTIARGTEVPFSVRSRSYPLQRGSRRPLGVDRRGCAYRRGSKRCQ